MTGGGARSFADYLDELTALECEAIEPSAIPLLQGDLLDQIERIQAENGSLLEQSARTAYNEPTLAPEILEALDTLLPDLSIDPDEIAQELRIDSFATVAQLDRARRRFAFANHPDRLAPHLRERAAERMSIANDLLDSARRRKVE